MLVYAILFVMFTNLVGNYIFCCINNWNCQLSCALREGRKLSGRRLALGVMLWQDQLTVAKSLAVCLAVIGLGYQIWQYGEVPVRSLVINCLFALYGFIRNFITFDIILALIFETLWVLPVAVILMYCFSVTDPDFYTPFHYILSAVVTLLPLLFSAAAISYTTITVVGLAQYLESMVQTLQTVVAFGEPFDLVKESAFCLSGWVCYVIWLRWFGKGSITAKKMSWNIIEDSDRPLVCSESMC